LKDQIDFWAAGKRAISILLFFEWKEINYDFQEIMNNICQQCRIIKNFDYL